MSSDAAPLGDRSAPPIRVMTYNVRACLGKDGVVSEERIAAVIRRYRPDVVALQELELGSARSKYVDQAGRLAELTGHHAFFIAAREDERGQFGNAVLARLPCKVVCEGALPVRWGEARAAQRLELRLSDGRTMDLVNTHLSIHFYERVLQIRSLFADAAAARASERIFPPLCGSTERLVLCGDFNAGRWSPVYRRLGRQLRDAQHRQHVKPRATWPASRPLLRLDHIWVGHGFSILSATVPRDELTAVASDHLPVIADLLLTQTSTEGQ